MSRIGATQIRPHWTLARAIARAHRIAYWRLECGVAAHRMAVALCALSALTPQSRRRNPSASILKIAAAFAVVAVIGAAAANFCSTPA